MALISCPECGNQISDKAHFCPHCGCSMNQTPLKEVFSCCPKCGSQVNNRTKFCGKCGFQLSLGAKFCGKCGTKITSNARYCPKCGASVSPINDNERDKKSSSKKIVIIGAIMILILVVATGVFFVQQNIKEKDEIEKNETILIAKEKHKEEVIKRREEETRKKREEEHSPIGILNSSTGKNTWRIVFNHNDIYKSYIDLFFYPKSKTTGRVSVVQGMIHPDGHEGWNREESQQTSYEIIRDAIHFNSNFDILGIRNNIKLVLDIIKINDYNIELRDQDKGWIFRKTPIWYKDPL